MIAFYYKMKYDLKKKEIILNRELNKLDSFVLDFIRILEKHVDYVIISGYVSIVLGRTRITEDVDIFIKEISEEKFLKLYDDIKKRGFWCLNAEKGAEIFDFLKNKMAARFSRKEKPVPNFEVKFPKDPLDKETFGDFITIILPKGKLKISSLERHIAFKRYYLASDKDIEDALHIEELFKDKIDHGKINKLKELIKIKKNEEKKSFFKAR